MIFRERQYERYDYKAPVLFKTDRYTLWKSGTILDISLGGILLQNDKLPAEGDLVDIRIANLIEGTFIQVQGNVVREVPPPRGPAVGIEFVVPRSTPELVRLCDILKKSQGEQRPLKGKITSVHARKEILSKAREFMDKAQFMDFYQTLDLNYDDSMTAVVSRQKDLLAIFTISEDGFAPNEAKAIKECLALIKRLTGILSNPQRRLGYDLARGKVSPSVVRECKELYGLDLGSFREYWESKFPQKLAMAEELMREASSASTPEAAHELKERACAYAPFSFIQ